MLEVSILDKVKRRKISAVRRFPGGCRIPAPTNETLNIVESDVPSIPLIILKEEPKESNGSTSLSLPPTPEEKEVKTVEDGSGRGKKRSGEEIVKLEGSSREVEDDGASGPTPKFVSGEGEGFRSRRYISPKKRKVSAVRKFPTGCGRNSSKIGSGVVMSSESKTDEKKLPEGGETFNNEEVMRSREDEVTKKVAEPMVKSPEPKNLHGEASVKACELKNSDREFMVKCSKAKDLDAGTMMKSPKSLNLDDESSVKSPMLNHLQGKDTMKSPKSKKSYAEDLAESPKPKKSEGEASARSPHLNNLQGEGRVKSPTFKISDGEALVESPKPKIIHDDGIAKHPKFKDLGGEEVMVKYPNSKNLDCERTVKSYSHKILDGELSIKSLELNGLEGEVIVKSPKSKSLNGEDMVTSTVPKNFDGEASVNSPKLKNSKEEAIVKSSKVRDLDEATMVNSPKMKQMHGEKSPVTEQLLKEAGIIGSSVEKVGVDVKKSAGKKIKEQAREISNEAQISPFKSSMNENIMEEYQEKKRLMRSASEKNIGGSGIKQASKKDKLKQESRGAGPQSGDKAVDSRGKSLMGKHGEKLSLNTPKDEDSMKRRKFADDAEDGSPISQAKESLEAYGERLVVQALMSAENCPWIKGKKPAATNSRSVMPKFKAKDKQKWTKSFSSEENEMDMEDEDGSVPQDSENGKVLVVYQQSQERSITLPPYAPPRQNHNGSNSEGASARAMVKRVLRLFQFITRKILQEEEAKSTTGFDRKNRVDLKANSILKNSNNYVNWNCGTRILGDVPGVEVGDEYHFRVELAIIGMHYLLQGGIDYMKRGDGMILATCIVASGGYSDDIDGSDILIYSGAGGNPAVGKDKKAGDQKLKRGNLALKNSIDAKTPVRVIYGFKEQLKGSDSSKTKTVSTLSYDGLYLVEKYWLEKGPLGFSVFKFQLRRMPGQPEIALKEVMKTKKSKIREGLIMKDISEGKERIPICVINTVDGEQPTPFKYITEVIYPSSYRKKPPRGCDCTYGCTDSENCTCAMKNGGEISFNYNGAIVQAKPLVYECGPSCKCRSSCHNRVSQHGIKIPLEIFKTQQRGWGVRSLYSIPSGSFICEYTGEMLQDTEAEQRSNDEYLFDIGHNYDDHALWEGLPNLIPSLQSNAVCETVEGGGFTIDAAEYGNVGRFINHSCSPNIYAQNVLYDHDDKRIPHIMFFAADNIPPLQELTYHYNYSIDQVRDEQGNVKEKACFCGSSECTGRLY